AMKMSHSYPILLAGLLAAAGVQAQSTPAAGSSDLPPKAGEASTMVQGKPNVDPNKPMARTRAEVVAELLGRRAAFEAERRALLNQDSKLGVMPRG
ncbi:MAG: hypothetical protein NDJ19_16645, partial [Ramlibacter sp.]|nr:hypothetical protein [Ramlibacter sp.]